MLISFRISLFILMSYPHLTHLSLEQAQNTILKSFNLKSKEFKKKTRKQLCFPKNFEYQLPQLFVREFINPKTPYKALLLFHKVGSGKTCAAIQIAQQWKNKRNVVIVTPASLKNNMYQEFRSECTGNDYVSNEERALLENLNKSSIEYLKLVKTINKRINANVNILSFNKFITMIQNNNINLRNSLLIIDEVHNIVSESGTFYNTLYNFLLNSPESLRIVILTATPIVDKPNELGLTMNLLRPKHIFPIGTTFNRTFIDEDINDIINKDKLQKYLKGYVSYYRGAPNIVFPIKEYKVINCTMSKYQAMVYKKIKSIEDTQTKYSTHRYLEVEENNFYVHSRQSSNMTFPNMLMGSKGYDQLNDVILSNPQILRKFSCKFSKLLTKLQYSRGTVFIYSNFKEYGGIKSLIKVLESYGYMDYNQHGLGIKRFAVWTGDENAEIKEAILNQFNDKANQNGTKIKILLGSPSIKEGVSLLRVREVHILEPHWNMSRLQQVIGRAIRFCSHKDVAPLRRIVKVFLYIAKIPKGINKQSIDQYILHLAKKKEDLIEKFENILVESAIDRLLY